MDAFSCKVVAKPLLQYALAVVPTPEVRLGPADGDEACGSGEDFDEIERELNEAFDAVEDGKA